MASRSWKRQGTESEARALGLILAWGNLCWTSDLQSHKITSACYFRPLNFTQFVTVATEMEKEMATHSSALAPRTRGQSSLVGCSPQGRTESDTTEAT